MNTWLLKTEPGSYSFADLRRDGKTAWTGVANFVAQRNLRNMRAADRAILYHTSNERAAVGYARVVREAYPDPTDKGGELVYVDIAPVERLFAPVALAALRADPAFANSPLVKQGRLSVVPLTDPQVKALERLARGRKDPVSS